MSTVTDFLIDISDNMSKKLNVARKLMIDEVAPVLSYSDKIGLRTFLSILGSPIIINRIDVGETTKSYFIEQLEKLPWPNGGTPTGEVVKSSLATLRTIDADRKRIVLVTSGTETEGGDYSHEVDMALADERESLQVDIIGFNLSGREEDKARDVTAKTSGVFCNISEDIYNDSIAIRNALKPLIDVLCGNDPVPVRSTPAPAPNPVEPVANIVVDPTPAPVAEPVSAPIAQEERTERIEVKTPRIEVETPKIEIRQSEPVVQHVEVKPEPAPTIEVRHVEIKVDNVQTQQSKAAFVESEVPEKDFNFETTTISSDTEYKDNSNIDKSAFEDKEKDEIDDDIFGMAEKKGSELAKTISDVVKSILNENADTVSLLKNKINQYKSEIDRLRTVGKESLKEIDNLVSANKSANGEISTLQNAINEASNMIKELKELRKKDKEEISSLRQMDEQVIVHDDVEARHANSKICEELLFGYLQKKYPGRVKWMNEGSKKTMGYDFEIRFDNNEVEYFIACKGIKGSERTFFLNKTEWEQCLKNNRNYQVYIINEFDSKAPKITVIDNLMGGLISGKVKPYTSQNKKVKANSVMFSLE